MPDQDIIGNSRSTQPTLERCVPLSAFNCTMDNFLGEETDFWRNMDRNEEKWNGSFLFFYFIFNQPFTNKSKCELYASENIVKWVRLPVLGTTCQ